MSKHETIDTAWRYYANAASEWVEQWSYTYGGYGHSQFAQPIGDIDEDEVIEIIVGGYESVGNGRARILSYDKSTKTYLEEYNWTHAGGMYNSPSGACVVDLDDDGDLEFVMSWASSGADGIHAYDWDSNTLTTLDIYTGTGFDLAFDVYACDYDDDGDVEVLIANAPNVVPGGFHVTALGWDNINDEFTQEAFWKLSGYEYSMECPMIWSGDTDNDGRTEVIACISDGDYATAGTWALNWNAATGQWQETLVYGGLIAGGTHYGVTVGDVDGDGIPEIGIGNNVEQYGAGACLFEWYGTSYRKVWEGSWSGEYPVIEAVAIGDADNDGNNEFCIGGGYVHIIGWTGSSYVEESTITYTSGVLSGVIIGDCDTDGLNELKACDIIIGPGKEWIFRYLKPPDDILIDEIIQPANLTTDLIAYRWPELLQEGDVITPSGENESEHTIESNKWFYWVNDCPYALFAHETRYVFIDEKTGDYEVKVEKWPPALNDVVMWPTPEEFWNPEYWVYTTLEPELNVVFEEAHLPAFTISTNPAYDTVGGYSEFASYLTINGYDVSTIDHGTTIESSILDPVDVLVVVAPQESYSTYEVDAIEDWVKGGGSLLLISEWGDFSFQAGSIASRFGISFAADGILDTDEYVGGETDWPYYHGANILAHYITDGVTRVEMYAGDGIESSPTNEIQLIITDSDGTATWYYDGSPAYGVPVMSAFVSDTVGSGRLVVIMDSNIWDSADDPDEDGAINFYDSDNEILALNAVNWLAGVYIHTATSSSSYESISSRIQPNIALTYNTLSQSTKRALIIQGHDPTGSLKNASKICYNLLLNFIYTDEEILYITPKEYDNTDYTCTKENVTNAIETLSNDLSSGDSLWVYVFAHGDVERDGHTGYIELVDGLTLLYDWELNQSLGQITDGVNITVMIESCYSGSFMDDLWTLDNVKMIITSTDWKSVSYTASKGIDTPEEYKQITDWDWNDTNIQDEGGEFSSGLIEGLEELKQQFINDKITLGELYLQAFKIAKERDAGYRNGDVLEDHYGSKKKPNPLLNTVFFPGDINHDGKVNITDIALAGKAYGSEPGDSNWNPNADTDKNRAIGIMDIATISKKYGTSY